MPDLVHAAMHQSTLVMAHTAEQGVQLHRNVPKSGAVPPTQKV